METFVAIVLSILTILCFIMICVAILFTTLFIQKLYAIIFERDDYKLYKEIKEYLKNNKMQLVPHTTLSMAQTYNDTLVDKYIFAAFYNDNEKHDVAIYDDDDTLRLTSFYNKLMQDLLKDAGYTQEDVDKAAIESNVRRQQLEKELEKAQKELEELEELVKRLKQSK